MLWWARAPSPAALHRPVGSSGGLRARPRHWAAFTAVPFSPVPSSPGTSAAPRRTAMMARKREERRTRREKTGQRAYQAEQDPKEGGPGAALIPSARITHIPGDMHRTRVLLQGHGLKATVRGFGNLTNEGLAPTGKWPGVEGQDTCCTARQP